MLKRLVAVLIVAAVSLGVLFLMTRARPEPRTKRPSLQVVSSPDRPVYDELSPASATGTVQQKVLKLLDGEQLDPYVADGWRVVSMKASYNHKIDRPLCWVLLERHDLPPDSEAVW